MKKAHYINDLKQNQQTLHGDTMDLPAQQQPKTHSQKGQEMVGRE